MDMMSIIGQYAFPIVACVAMAWYVKKKDDDNREQLNKIMDQHRNEMKDITSALNNNTMALHQLSGVISGFHGELNKGDKNE